MTAVCARRGLARAQFGLAATITFTAAVGCGAPARAQVSLAASLESDYRLRGYSLTEGRPALSASLAYDAPSGIYLGASGVAGNAPDAGLRGLGYIAYGGYAHRFASGRSFDVGLSRTQLKGFEHSRWSAIHYTEAYVGASTEHLTLRALYSPHYLRDGAKTLYLDLGAGAEPAPHWRVSAHAGLLHYLDRPEGWRGRVNQYDLRAVIAREFDHGDLHVTWTMRGPDDHAPTAGRERRDGLGVGLSYVF